MVYGGSSAPVPPASGAPAPGPFAPGGAIRVIGHRGAAGCAPENTLPAIHHAVEVGADAIELDLHATRDGRLVLLHDDVVDRVSDGSGPVEEMTLDEARSVDAGYAFTPDRGRTYPFRGQGVRFPTLEEALAAAGSLPVVAEVKTGRAAEALDRFLAGAPAESDRVLVGGFTRAAVDVAAGRARWRCAAEEDLRAYVILGKLGLGRLPAGRPPEVDAVMVPERHGPLRIVTRRFVRRTRRHGIGVFVWTVNEPGDMRRLLDRGVDGLISDFPGRVRRIVDERDSVASEREAG
jgi:glycerophosphoryl diester phosphodiesterase